MEGQIKALPWIAEGYCVTTKFTFYESAFGNMNWKAKSMSMYLSSNTFAFWEIRNVLLVMYNRQRLVTSSHPPHTHIGLVQKQSCAKKSFNENCSGCRIPSQFKAHFISHQLSDLTTMLKCTTINRQNTKWASYCYLPVSKASRELANINCLKDSF